MATSYYGMIEEVCVMLVDNDKEFVTATTDLLKSHNYTVMTVDSTSTAMSTLSKGKQKIDMMILNVHSTNLLSFDLLAQAVALDIISLVVCDELNEHVAKKVLDDGAYLYLKKPLNKEIVKYLWQFVFSEKIRSEKARERSEKNKDYMKVYDIDNNDIVGENEGESQNNATNKVVRQKNYIEWTEDLHTKFMEAVQLLGEGRCYPKEILEVMNVPGLTRMQVASHLQKCRRNNWRSPKERKSIRYRSGQRSSSVSHEPRSGFRKFGTMPRLQANVPNQQRNPNQTQRGQEFPFPTLNTNNTFARGESSIQQQFYRPQVQVQVQVQPHRPSIGNQILTTQTNVGGGLQHGPLFDLNASPGATYSGNRIVLGTYYDLNANVDNVTTYSSSAMNVDTYIGNVTINGSGATNANFQQYVGEPNMSDPRNTIVGSYEDYVGNRAAYFNFNNADYLFQNLGPPGANLPNEQVSEFDQIYSDDQVAGTSSIQFTGIGNHSDESSM